MRVRLHLCLFAASLLASAAAAQNNTTVIAPAPSAGSVTKSAARPKGVNSPVPAGLTAAHRVFLSNAGSDAGLFPHPFTGTQDRGYGYVFKKIEEDKRWEMVRTPTEADIVLEIHLSAPNGVIGSKQLGTSDGLPTFKLVAYDRPTHYVLWSLTQTVDKANLQKTHDKNFDDALDLLLADFGTAASVGATASK